MSGGGGNPSTSTVVQSNLPEYAQPYFESLMDAGLTETARPYVDYGQPKVAGFSGTQQRALAGIGNMNTPDTFQLARLSGANMLQNSLNASNSAANYAPGSFEYAGFQSFNDNNNATKYMSPYINKVIDYEKNSALRDYQIQQLGRNAQAVKAGAYGGYRQGIENSEALRNLNSQMQGIEDRGLQNAYTNAQGQFNQEGQQYLQTVGQRLAAQQQAEASRQFGLSSALQAGQLGQGVTSGLASLGQQEQQGKLDLYGAQLGAGNMEQQLQQQAINQNLADFENQRDYARNQLQYYAGLLRGVPVTANSNTTQTPASPSMVSQLGGMGIAGLGLYNATKG